MASSISVGALPLNVDLLGYQGDDLYLDVAVTDPDDGSPVDLTGHTAESQIRSTPPSTEIMAAFDATIAGNIIHLHLPADQSSTVSPPAAWDVQTTDTNGIVRTYAYGLVRMQQQVTR